MTRVARIAWAVEVLYAAAVTGVAAVLLLGGVVLSGVPGLPTSVDRRYGAATMRVVDLLFRPLDAVPTVRPADGD